MASYVAPRTWVTGEVVTASQGNEQWRDNMIYTKEMGENASIGVIFDGAGANISTDAVYMMEIPGPCTIQYGVMSSFDVCDFTIDIRRENSSDMVDGGVFDSDDSLTDSDSGAFLTLSCDSYVKTSASTNWTLDLLESDVLRFHVMGNVGGQNVAVQLGVHKT